MDQNSKFERILNRLYASGTYVQGMQPFLSELESAFGAHIAAFELRDPLHSSGHVHTSVGMDPREIEHYASLASSNLWYERGAVRLLERGVDDTSGLVTERELLDSSFYQEWLQPLNIFHSLAFLVDAGESGHVVAATVSRSKHCGSFNRDELELAERLLPHMRNVYGLQRQLSWIQHLLTGLRTALDHTPAGVILLDRRGYIVFKNEQASRLCAERRGIVESKRMLVAAWPSCRNPLRKLIEEACSGVLRSKPENLRVRDFEGRVAALVRANPLPALTTISWSEPSVAAILFITSLQPSPPPAHDVLRAMFGLSRAEADVAISIANGMTIAGVSEHCGKSIATLRTQLRAVFAKTNTRRQSELVRLLDTLTEGDRG